MLDGVFARDRAEALRFHPTRRLTTLDVEEVLATVEPLIMRRLERRGLGPGEADAPDAWTDEAPVLAELAAASVQGAIVLGPRRGARVRRFGDAAEPVETPAPGRTGLICTPAWSCRAGKGSSSSVSAATPCGRR